MNFNPTALSFFSLITISLLTLPSSAEPVPLSSGIPALSSQAGANPASKALDDLANFTHTTATDPNPTWQVLLPDYFAFDVIEAFNREASDGITNCCGSRFRDITIQVVDFTGDVTTDFTGGTVVHSSELLNPENVFSNSNNADGPVSLTTDAGGAFGNMIRIIRTPDPDLSGTGGLGNTDEAAVLSLDLVTADGLLKALQMTPANLDSEGNHFVPSSTMIGDSIGTLIFVSGSVEVATFTLVAGEGDTNNSLYTIGGPNNDQILVNSDLSVLDNVDHTVRIIASADGEDAFETSFPFTITGDTDDDGLPDSWEMMFGVLADFTTGGNADGDGLTDEEEFVADTDPSKADSDDDGVDDDVELADGTDPRDPDSDNDGLNDGDEKAAGSDPFLIDTDGDSLTDSDEVNIHGSSPILSDTDSDGFDDSVEVVRGSNPSDPNSVPEIGTSIPLETGIVAQSSQLGGFGPGNALDDVVNFTATSGSDANPTWQVLLPEAFSFGIVEIFNRSSSGGTTDCCPSRLRDITVEIVQFDGDVSTDFTGGTVLFTSELLNPENLIGGGTNTAGPVSLIVDAEGATGNMLRIRRTVDSDLSGTGGAGNADEGSVLSMDLVTAEVSAGGGTQLAITDISYDPNDQMVSLTWASKPNRTYGVFFWYDLITFDSDVNDNVASTGDATTFTFTTPDSNAKQLFFRVVEVPSGG